MSLRRNSIAIRALLVLLSLFMAATAYAVEAVGSVINVSGPLLARKADGTMKLLAQKSAVYQGDTLATEKGTYARIRFIDKSEVTLRPNSQLVIDSFVFDEGKPETDSAKFNLVKGGLRAVTGALGKRSQDRVGLNTPTATIGIRGTTFIAEYVAPPQATTGNLPPAESNQLAQSAPPQPGRPTGLYVQVLDGRINVSNNGGSLDFVPGQFGYAPSMNQPPIQLPANPGMQFAPPPAFSSNTNAQGVGEDSSSAGAECEVR